MSVLVRGMEMPQKCSSCPFRNAFSIDCSLTHMRLDRDDFFQYRDERCPLVEVPTPHGRLVDADEVHFTMTDSIEQGRAEEALNNAPTVIEAEVEP